MDRDLGLQIELMEFFPYSELFPREGCPGSRELGVSVLFDREVVLVGKDHVKV